MKKHAKPLTRQELAAVEDKDIDFSDIPEMGDDFWDKAKIVHLSQPLALDLEPSIGECT